MASRTSDQAGEGRDRGLQTLELGATRDKGCCPELSLSLPDLSGLLPPAKTLALQQLGRRGFDLHSTGVDG